MGCGSSFKTVESVRAGQGSEPRTRATVTVEVLSTLSYVPKRDFNILTPLEAQRIFSITTDPHDRSAPENNFEVEPLFSKKYASLKHGFLGGRGSLQAKKSELMEIPDSGEEEGDEVYVKRKGRFQSEYYDKKQMPPSPTKHKISAFNPKGATSPALKRLTEKPSQPNSPAAFGRSNSSLFSPTKYSKLKKCNHNILDKVRSNPIADPDEAQAQRSESDQPVLDHFSGKS